MIIKNVFNVKNYKGLEDGTRINFQDITYIIGDNGKNKTTIGSLPLWILTGYNFYGGNRENVANDNLESQNRNTIASMTIIDNDGREHTITRIKGKDNLVMLDEIKTTQEILTRFYKDTHAFICSYYPNYFRSLGDAKQRELLLRILPAISSEDAFKLLEQEEQEILENPVLDFKGFAKAKRAEIKELNSELDKLQGSKNMLVDVALQKEEEKKEFTKQKELDNLEEQYEKLIENTDNILTLGDLEKDINKLNERITRNIKVDLEELKERYKKENENLKNVSATKSICSTCKQEITNEDMIKALKIGYRKNLNNIENQIQKLKDETKEFMEKREKQIKQYNIMRTPEMQEKLKLREELKEKIDSLKQEKTNIDLYNKEIEIKHKQIIEAKQKIENFENTAEEIIDTINKYKKQIEIVTRLNLLVNQEQMKSAEQYLKNVNIEFSRVDEETGEIIEEYKVRYKGREYENLSKSYKLRADIEIATMINKAIGINTPMFIDDVESITSIDTNSDMQIILAIVVKYNDLEVLYDYQEVLLRERNSINKKIEENSNLMKEAA